MNPAVSLGLKYLLGLGVVAGAAGGGIVYWKKVSDSKAEEERIKKMEKNSEKWKKERALREREEATWLPKECISKDRAKGSIECNLTSGDLKKIKFKELGEGEEEVTVTPSESENIKLTIILLGDLKKKFQFTNESNQNIVVSKGGKTVTLRANGDTEFLREKEGLAKMKLEDYGIRGDCMNEVKTTIPVRPEYSGNANIKQCILTAGDLSKIKFHGFSDDEESVVTPLWVNDGNNNWKHDHAIVLTIKDGKYGFYNFFSDFLGHNQLAHKPITITRGKVSVTLEGNMESVFTVEGDSLKKQEVTVLGFPKRCEMGAEEQNKTCELSDNDIRRLKLKDTGVSPDLLPVDGNRKMKVKIEKATDSNTYPDGKKYILSALDSPITITSTVEAKEGMEPISKYHTKSLTFGKGVEKIFKNENNQLVAI